MAAFVHIFKKAEESSMLLPRQSQELGFRTLSLPLASDNNLDLTASPVTTMISSDMLKDLGNRLVQATLSAMRLFVSV